MARPTRAVPVAFLVLLCVPMVATAVRPSLHPALVRDLGATWPALRDGRVWRLATSSLVQDERGISWPIVALLPALLVAGAMFGPWLTLGIFYAADVTATAPVLAVLRETTPNTGASAGLIGLIAACIAAGRPGRLRAVAATVLAGGLALEAALDWELATAQHMIAAVVGAGLGYAVRGASRRRRRAGSGS